jgi:hypothetical protein
MVSKDSIVIDHSDWLRVQEKLKSFAPTFKRDLRRNIKVATEGAAQKVRETLALPSPGGGPDNTGGRAALIAATRISVSFRASSVSAAIVTSSSKLPDKHKGLLKVYNKASFRHPVFETNAHAVIRKATAKTDGKRVKALRSAEWVVQEGRPYFGKVISAEMHKTAVVAIRAALQEAMLATGAK